jgi:predicted dehydrogenase
MGKKILLGMVGGGPGAMIGDIHRLAARMDNHYELVAGAFSRDHKKSIQLNEALGLSSDRIYPSYRIMFEKEKLLPVEKRIEVVSIVTPNNSHFDIAALAIQSRFHVIVDKPMTNTLDEAKEIKHLLTEFKRLLCVTYTYSGYPMVKEMRHLMQSGKIGNLRKIIVVFSQGWLTHHLEKNNPVWRMDPKQSGGAGTLIDIGTHAFHLAEYVTGLRVIAVCADMTTMIPNRVLDDDSTILLKFENDARGILMVSQVATGDEVTIDIHVYAEQASLHWSHENPNSLLKKSLNQPAQVFTQGSNNAYLSVASRFHCRTSAGHPEGYLEAFANHYRSFALHLNAVKNNLHINPEWDDYPKIDDGMRGVAFVEKVITSQQTEKWLNF